MASQVLSGTSDVSYTNNTGQNVRIVINFMRTKEVPIGFGVQYELIMSWAGVSVTSGNVRAIGRNLAYAYSGTNGSSSIASVANNAFGLSTGFSSNPSMDALPTELMLAPGQTFTASGINAYNIVIIPEGG